jgi:hypothetical protein
MPEAWETLYHINAHPRDERITFYEPTHTYTIDGSSEGIISGTGFLHQFFGHFNAKEVIEKMMRSPKWASNKHYGKTADQIAKEWSDSGKDASTKGTAMHLAIEQFMNRAESVIDPDVKKTVEFQYFMNFWNDHGWDLEPYRAEWSVFSQDHMLCGQIDMLFRRKSDGKFLIYDWKRSREIKTSNKFQKGLAPLQHLDDCNYWHYTLQLNLYRWILEKLYGMEIAEMYLIICHPENKNYKRMRLNRLDDEIEAMLDCRKRALEFKWHKPVMLPTPEVEGVTVKDDYAFLDE